MIHERDMWQRTEEEMKTPKQCSKCGRHWIFRYGTYAHRCIRLVHPSRRDRRKTKRRLLKRAKLPRGLARDRSWHQVKELVGR